MEPRLGPGLIGQIRFQFHQLPLQLGDHHPAPLALSLQGTAGAVGRHQCGATLLIGGLQCLRPRGRWEIGGGAKGHGDIDQLTTALWLVVRSAAARRHGHAGYPVARQT